MFQLTKSEKQQLVAKCDHLSQLRYSSTNPNAFTEHGFIMAASVLHSPQAIKVSVLVVKTFVKLRAILANHEELGNRLAELEIRLEGHDETIQSLIIAINELINPTKPTKRHPIGFAPWAEEKKEFAEDKLISHQIS